MPAWKNLVQWAYSIEVKGIYKLFFGFWFRLFGWEIIGSKPDLKKYIIVVAPHTSNWDFAVGYSLKYIHDLHPNFLAKKSLFGIPLIGWFLRINGGEPIDRDKKTNMVDQVVEKFKTLDQFIMAITPEGTRAYSPEWKTGFHRIGLKANVPIVMIGFDFGRKQVVVGKPMSLSENLEADVELMKKFFRPMKGRNPALGVD